MAALDSTFGAFFIGAMVSAVLYGATCVQTWYYFVQYPFDLWYLKLLVWAIFISDTIHQVLITHTVYTYLVTDFGNFVDLSKFVWSLFVSVLFNAFTTAMVQSFLTMRIYKLSNRTHIVATGCVLSLTISGFVSAIACVVKGLQLTDFAQLGDLKLVSIFINAFAAAADVLIAFFLCTLLQKARAGFQRTDHMIKKLTIFSINTGLITSICAMMSLISLLVWPTTFIFIGCYFCIGRLYCNTMLATLNARNDIRGDLTDDNVISLQAMQKSATNQISASQRQNKISIKIETERDYAREEDSTSGNNFKSDQAI